MYNTHKTYFFMFVHINFFVDYKLPGEQTRLGKKTIEFPFVIF